MPDSINLKVADYDIDVRQGCVYLKIGSRTFCIEHSNAAPMYVSTWIDCEPNTHFEATWKKVEDEP